MSTVQKELAAEIDKAKTTSTVTQRLCFDYKPFIEQYVRELENEGLLRGLLGKEENNNGL